MKKITISVIALVLFTLTSCEEQPQKPKLYKTVTKITSTSNTYPVTITKQKGGNVLQRAAGGALLGGGVDMIMGGRGKSGAIVGGLAGAATTSDPSIETYTQMRTDVVYTVFFNDSTKCTYTDYCPVTVGQSVEIHNW